MFIALLLGAISGLTTGVLFTKIKVNHLLAGLITTTASFSLSLAISSANKIIPHHLTIFAFIPVGFENAQEILVLMIFAICFIFLAKWFLYTESGLLLRASGDNPAFLFHLGKSSQFYQILGFGMANAVAALSGALFAQYSGFFSITANIGTLLTAIATVMIAELFVQGISLVIIIASITYQGIFYFTLFMALDPKWSNLIKALIMVFLISLKTISGHKFILRVKNNA